MIRRIIILIVICLAQLTMAGCTNNPQQQSVATATSQLLVSSESKVLSTVNNLHTRSEAPGTHIPQDDIAFSRNGRGVAYVADNSSGQFVVHNDKAGSVYGEIAHLKISPDGLRVSYGKKIGEYWQMVSDGVASKAYKDVYDPVYSPNSRHVAFLAEDFDGMTYVILDGKPIDSYHNIVSSEFLFSHDSGMLIYHARTETENKAYLVMYDLKTKAKTGKSCLDTTAVVMNEAKSHLAAAALIDGKQVVINFSVANPDKVHQSSMYDQIKHISFSRDGKSVAFLAGKNGKVYLVLNDREYLLPGNFAVADAPIMSDDGTAASVVFVFPKDERSLLHALYQTGQRFEDKQLRMIRELVYSSKGVLAYVAAEGERYFVVINGKPGPEFDAVVAPAFSPDGRKLVYRARDGARRMVVTANADGTGLQRLPSYEMVFPIGFTADGGSIGYGVKEGNKLIWKVDKL